MPEWPPTAPRFWRREHQALMSLRDIKRANVERMKAAVRTEQEDIARIERAAAHALSEVRRLEGDA